MHFRYLSAAVSRYSLFSLSYGVFNVLFVCFLDDVARFPSVEHGTGSRAISFVSEKKMMV